jgi:hypothetical protein
VSTCAKRPNDGEVTALVCQKCQPLFSQTQVPVSRYIVVSLAKVSAA